MVDPRLPGAVPQAVQRGPAVVHVVGGDRHGRRRAARPAVHSPQEDPPGDHAERQAPRAALRRVADGPRRSSWPAAPAPAATPAPPGPTASQPRPRRIASTATPSSDAAPRPPATRPPLRPTPGRRTRPSRRGRSSSAAPMVRRRATSGRSRGTGWSRTRPGSSSGRDRPSRPARGSGSGSTRGSSRRDLDRALGADPARRGGHAPGRRLGRWLAGSPWRRRWTAGPWSLQLDATFADGRRAVWYWRLGVGRLSRDAAPMRSSVWGSAGRRRRRPGQARAGAAVALKIEVCASSGSITPKIFCSVRRWTQEPQLSK